VKRLQRLYPHFQQALAITLDSHKHRFQAILDVLEEHESFPILMQIDDYSGCLKDNYGTITEAGQDKQSLPIMTLARRIGCPYYFAIPSFELFSHATIPTTLRPWDDVFANWTLTYKSLDNKIPMVFWRGSCSGRPKRHKFVKQARPITSLFDVQFTVDCLSRDHKENTRPPEESMKYRAVFDIDGNSFSGRFSRLLCYNSVVIKINTEPDYEEYFMNDLTPGVHFLSASMDNFTDVALYAVQDSSLSAMKAIVQNANAWCKQKLNLDVLYVDFLRIVNGIIEKLNVKDNTWIDQWKQSEHLYLTHNSTVSSEILDWQV
jgi:Glycosyl transferase family 90